MENKQDKGSFFDCGRRIFPAAFNFGANFFLFQPGSPYFCTPFAEVAQLVRASDS
jgi:hypothetical protein